MYAQPPSSFGAGLVWLVLAVPAQPKASLSCKVARETETAVARICMRLLCACPMFLTACVHVRLCGCVGGLEFLCLCVCVCVRALE